MAATYHETLKRLGMDLPAYEAAVKVYLKPSDPNDQLSAMDEI